MSTPEEVQEPKSKVPPMPPKQADSAATAELHRRFCSDVPNDGTYTLHLNETETIRFFAEADRLIAAHCAAATAKERQARELAEGEVKRLKRNEAICHCGSPVSAHGIGDGHSPVEMPQECPYAAQLTWKGGVPDVPEGYQRPFLCSVNGGKGVIILLYSNQFVGPASDEADPDDEQETSPDSGEYYWTGWFEEACSQCDTFWRWDKPVDGWMPLPAAKLAPAPAGGSAK